MRAMKVAFTLMLILLVVLVAWRASNLHPIAGLGR